MQISSAKGASQARAKETCFCDQSRKAQEADFEPGALSGKEADLDTHVHTRFLQVHVEAGNLCLGDLLGHALARPAHVQGVAVQESALPGALTMGFQHIDGLDGVLGFLTICASPRKISTKVQLIQQENYWKTC